MAKSGLVTGSVVKRDSARLFIVRPGRQVLLFRYSYEEGPLSGISFWATPGGGLEPGESFEDAARRELMEETGITAAIGAPVHIHFNRFPLPDGRIAEAEERYFLVLTDGDCTCADNPDLTEADAIAETRWWRFEEIATAADIIYPRDILPLLERLAGGEKRRAAALP